MIIKNEIDRIRFIRELQSMELPIDIAMGEYLEMLKKVILEKPSTIYVDTPEPTLGDHTSGMEDCCE